MIIVDASVALSWCLADEADDYAERILDRVADEATAAPSVWPLEVANGILSAERRGRIEPDDVDRVARLLNQLNVEVVPVELTTAFWTILDTARDLGLSVYDAAYLDLARYRNASLATIDGQMREAAKTIGVAQAE